MYVNYAWQENVMRHRWNEENLCFHITCIWQYFVNEQNGKPEWHIVAIAIVWLLHFFIMVDKWFHYPSIMIVTQLLHSLRNIMIDTKLNYDKYPCHILRVTLWRPHHSHCHYVLLGEEIFFWRENLIWKAFW